MNANSHHRKKAKCTKCTEAEQHTQTAEAQSPEVAARDANSHAERLVLEFGGANQRAEEFQRRVVEAKKRIDDWRISRGLTFALFTISGAIRGFQPL
ncbi:uncharacterized protein N7487_008888 [Penicillium crustosum]|uniref:uncharacterized protein n=1 Tax=Penicillium crustosum TaxID=36656 RepID=UPI00239EFD61|nr:uncharacterized protein N7487_008888 [Penicillium crustosum]KAJ5402992.1 hypothetical protein N7487_008888 [Penicillium crustosum]